MNEPPSGASSLDAESLSRLAGGLVHELKNPLSTIGLHLSLLLEQWEGEAGPKARQTVRTLQTVQQEVGRLNEILEDFLRFARTDHFEPEMVALNDVVERVVEFVAPETKSRGIELRTFLDLDLPEIRVDAGRVRQSLLNLLINARQALGDREGQITVISRHDGEHVILEVVDDGPGMSPADLERCTEVYFSTKKSGSGLGLPMVRRITEAHGGAMEIESAPGHGTRIRLLFPIPRTAG